MGDTQDKTDAYAALDQSEVDDYLQDILGNEPITCDCQEWWENIRMKFYWTVNANGPP